MIKLGQQVKCRITGFEGTAIARTEWINGCARIMVQPKVDKEGKLSDPQQFDEKQLEVTGQGTYLGDADKPVEERTGGPAPLPRRT